MAMLRPTYMELIEKANNHREETGEGTEIRSRYPVVLAAAKRARQLIDGAPGLVKENGQKPLSQAVEEIYKDKITISFDQEAK